MNKRVASLVVFVLLSALYGFGANGLGTTKPHRAMAHQKHPYRVSAQNQFHFQPTSGPAKDFLDRQRAELRAQAPASGGGVQARRGQPMAPQAHATPVRRHANPPLSSIGFVSATQIPAGGYFPLGGQSGSLSGDFDGDGNLDLISLVGDPANPGNFSLAVVLSNGDGTFQAPMLTPEPGNNSNDRFVVGDVDGDGFDDVIVAHQAGGGAAATFDVLLSNGDGTFKLGNNYLITGNSLSGGTLADVNGDGFLDVVFVDSATPSNVWTVLNNADGTGTFSTTPTSVALSAQVGFDVVLADLNGDGFLDVTANDGVTHEQTVYLSTAATTFASGVLVDTLDGIHDACSTTVGDLTGDGFPEIVNTNCLDNTITIYVNNGDGTFAPGVYYDAAQGLAFVDPESVTIADVNGDGFADVISSNDFSSDVTVLLGNGDGTVQVPTVGYTGGGYFFSPAIVADFNGDGLADIMVPDEQFSLVYMKGYGDGTFRAAVDYYTPSSDHGEPSGNDIATGDFNGDGLPDVVIGNTSDLAGGITVFLSRPDGTMQPGVNYGSGGFLGYVAVADFDGDGKLDIAATDSSTGMVQIFKGAGDGTFTLGTAYATGAGASQSSGIVVSDFDQDGHPDLAVANFLGSNVGVLLNDGSGGFLAPVTYATCSGATQITAADLNGDGFPDLLTPLPTCTGMTVLLNNGDGTGTFKGAVDFGVGNSPVQVAVGDLNEDGKVDLAITMDDPVNGHGITVALGKGDGTFTVVNTPGVIPPYPTTLKPNYYSPYPAYIKMVDLDGDGHLDLVYTNQNFGTVGVMYGKGDGTFYDPVEYPSEQISFGLALADVNGDGAVDAVTVGVDTSAVTVLLNNSGSAALPDYAVSAAPPSATVTAGASATYTITVAPNNFYNGTISFSCGTLPSLTTCTFGPTTLTPNGNGQLTTTLTVTTTAPTTSMLAPPQGNPQGNAPILWASLSGMGVFGLMLAGDWKKRRVRWMGVVLGIVILGMMFSLVGCGGSSNNPPPVTKPGTPTGSYTIQITATGTAGSNGGNTSAHNVSVGLTVQ